MLHNDSRSSHEYPRLLGEMKKMLYFPPGKTTVLYKIKLNEVVTTIPTIGFNVETVQPVKGLQFTVWDIGGQQKIRQLWRQYFYNSEGICLLIL